jgi:hypothetical protein
MYVSRISYDEVDTLHKEFIKRLRTKVLPFNIEVEPSSAKRHGRGESTTVKLIRNDLHIATLNWSISLKGDTIKGGN